MTEALFYLKLGDAIQCVLCPNLCVINHEERGICQVRKNDSGILITEGYGNISSFALDPIEKKPLYHFYPGTDILSVGGLGCNLRCSFCQNWQISQQQVDTRFICPEELIYKIQKNDSVGIAFTYNEPIINYEYILDVCQLAKNNNLRTVLVTNGFIMPEPLKRLLPFIDAMNIDVKAFSEEYYKEICGGILPPVKKTVELAARHCHIELTTLVVGGVNDELTDMKNLFKWVKGIDANIPLHLSRYFPNYKMDQPATPIDTMISLRDLGLLYLNYVYLGNMSGIDNNTYCKRCHQLLVDRGHFKAKIVGLNQGICSNCQNPAPLLLK